jgi:tRNA-modifying protein YgfZ
VIEPGQSLAGELDRLAEGAVVHAAGRELIVATGADRARFLHGLVTGDVAGQPPGRGARAALLTPKGHVVGDLSLLVRPDDIWIVVDAGQAVPISQALGRYAIMDDFAAAPRAEFSIVSVLGPAAVARLGQAGVDPGALASAPPLAHAAVGELSLVRVRELGVDGFWLIGAVAAVVATRARLAAAGVPDIARQAAEVARIAAVEPMFGVEITSDYFPMEVGLGGAIDYAKGCYLGQEPIVRIRDRGHINWRLGRLDVLADRLPSPGDRVETDAKPKAGRITSAAPLPDGRAVALAMVHVSVPIGAEVRIVAAQVPDSGPPVSTPARLVAEAV